MISPAQKQNQTLNPCTPLSETMLLPVVASLWVGQVVRERFVSQKRGETSTTRRVKETDTRTEDMHLPFRD